MIKQDRWKLLKKEIRDAWGTITEEELNETRGDFLAIEDLIHSKYGDREHVRVRLGAIFNRASSGNPETYDRYHGTKEAQESDKDGRIVQSKDPESQEWQAREDINQDNQPRP